LWRSNRRQHSIVAVACLARRQSRASRRHLRARGRSGRNWRRRAVAFFSGVPHTGILRIAWHPALQKNLLSYGAVMASAVTAVPVAQLLIRIDMSERLG